MARFHRRTSLSENVFISLAFQWDIFTGCRILCWHFFFSALWRCHPTIFWLSLFLMWSQNAFVLFLCMWWVIFFWLLLRFFFIFGFQTFKYDVSGVLFFLIFLGICWASWIFKFMFCFVYQFWGKFGLSTFYLAPSLFSLIGFKLHIF